MTADDHEAADLARARDGDDAAFTALVAPLRPELHAHCYRMLGSAARRRRRPAGRAAAGLAGAAPVRGAQLAADLALHRRHPHLPGPRRPAAAGGRCRSTSARPATTPCRRRRRRPTSPWLGPYPDAGLAAGPASPDARYEQREAVELAFVAALQHLPGNQRAALLLFDVLGFSAAEIAAMMDTSTARSTARCSGPAGSSPSGCRPAASSGRCATLGDARLREIVAGYATALERGDADALVALLTEDVTWSMPPLPHWYRGRDAVTDFAGRCR